jgi:hypothetical protein
MRGGKGMCSFAEKLSVDGACTALKVFPFGRARERSRLRNSAKIDVLRKFRRGIVKSMDLFGVFETAGELPGVAKEGKSLV